MTVTTDLDLTPLRRAVRGRVVTNADGDYDTLRSGFNGMIDRRPAAIVRVTSEADVAATVAFAWDHGLPLALRAGGHSAPGHFTCQDGIVVDCRELDAIEVDPTTATVRCGSGLTWKEFDAATLAHGLAVTGGRVSGTGVTGLTIGSGSGWLERAAGLTSDRLVGARLVTADGRTVDTDDDPDLLWALRGGGGNFGVLTELRFGLRPLGPTVLGGKRLYPLARGNELLRTFGEVMLAAPKELCGGLAFITAPPAPWVPAEVRGQIVVATITLWAGDPAEAEAGMAALDALGPPLYDGVHEMPYTEIQQIMDPGAPPGRRDYFKGGFMSTLSAGAVEDIVDIGAHMLAPLTQVICAPLGQHTAYAAVDETHSAIGHRQEEWSFQVLSLWDDERDDPEQKAWTRAAAETMSSYSDMVSYPNFLTADESADSRLVEAAYSPGVFARLRSVKDRYDPDNLFRINNNIVPTAPCRGSGRMTDDLAAQVQWLVDRAAISDLLVEFARTLDEREWEANTQLYVPDGTFEIAGAVRLEGHEQLRGTGTGAGLAQYAGTWHLSANPAITVDGDDATTRSYLIGVHLLDAADRSRHADGAGWYDCTLRRTPEGWRFVTVRITEKWTAGEPLPHVRPAGDAPS